MTGFKKHSIGLLLIVEETPDKNTTNSGSKFYTDVANLFA